MNSTTLNPFPGPTLTQSEEGLDPRVQRTRQHLREALISLLREKGFEEISVQDITERATVNRVTFYDHFEDKFALLDNLIGESFRAMLRARMTENAGSAREKLRPLFLALCDYLQKLSRCCKAYKQPLFSPLVESRVKTLLCDMVGSWLEEEPSFTLRVPAPLGATLAGWSIYGAALEWIKTEEPVELFVDQVMPSILVALYKGE